VNDKQTIHKSLKFRFNNDQEKVKQYKNNWIKNSSTRL